MAERGGMSLSHADGIENTPGLSGQSRPLWHSLPLLDAISWKSELMARSCASARSEIGKVKTASKAYPISTVSSQGECWGFLLNLWIHVVLRNVFLFGFVYLILDNLTTGLSSTVGTLKRKPAVMIHSRGRMSLLRK